MSLPRAPKPASLAVAVLVSPRVSLDPVFEALGRVFSPVREVSPEVPFTQASYYEPEMGGGLRRVYVGLEGVWDPGDLAEIKLRSNELEARWASGRRRGVNLDPGLVDLDRLVLASCKPAGHRVYVGRGVHAEVEYVFQYGTFRPLPWTYPDYREPRAIEFFNQVRERHRRARKEAR